jgi:hypothetical protein
MSLLCSAIIGFLCVRQPIGGVTNVKLEDQGIWVANTVTAPNWKASWGRSMEWPAPKIDPSRFVKACVGEACISYWRFCTAPYTCNYIINDGHGFALTAKIEAKDKKGLDEGMQAVGVVAKWQQPVIAVPLAAMNVEGKGNLPPICIANGPEPQPGPCKAPEN